MAGELSFENFGDVDDTAHRAALDMLDAFVSVTAYRFDLTLTDAQGCKIRYRAGLHHTELKNLLPALLDATAQQGQNVIVRPHGSAMWFVQLDDLDADKTERVKPAAFLSLETSPGNFQAWIALPERDTDPDLPRRIRKGAGADPSASGATRVAGSVNFKDKYAPDFPRVQFAHSSPGLIATPEQLDALGVVAAPEQPAAKPFRVSPQSGRMRPGPSVRKWPSYAMCLKNAPPNHSDTGTDTSRADFVWCMTALDWGWSAEDTAARLMEESAKAQQNGEKYARLTVQNAAAAVARNRGGR